MKTFYFTQMVKHYDLVVDYIKKGDNDAAYEALLQAVNVAQKAKNANFVRLKSSRNQVFTNSGLTLEQENEYYSVCSYHLHVLNIYLGVIAEARDDEVTAAKLYNNEYDWYTKYNQLSKKFGLLKQHSLEQTINTTYAVQDDGNFLRALIARLHLKVGFDSLATINPPMPLMGVTKEKWKRGSLYLTIVQPLNINDSIDVPTTDEYKPRYLSVPYPEQKEQEQDNEDQQAKRIYVLPDYLCVNFNPQTVHTSYVGNADFQMGYRRVLELANAQNLQQALYALYQVFSVHDNLREHGCSVPLYLHIVAAVYIGMIYELNKEYDQAEKHYQYAIKYLGDNINQLASESRPRTNYGSLTQVNNNVQDAQMADIIYLFALCSRVRYKAELDYQEMQDLVNSAGLAEIAQEKWKLGSLYLSIIQPRGINRGLPGAQQLQKPKVSTVPNALRNEPEGVWMLTTGGSIIGAPTPYRLPHFLVEGYGQHKQSSQPQHEARRNVSTRPTLFANQERRPLIPKEERSACCCLIM